MAIACSTAFAAALTVSLAQSALAATRIIVPDNLPASLKVDPPNHPFLLGKAEGTQNYVCLPAGVDAAGNPKFAWTLFTPEATLFRDDPDDPKQLITHFFSPNLSPDSLETSPNPPFAEGPIRATWQSSQDASSVWARTVVAGDAVPSLWEPFPGSSLLGRSPDGPHGGDVLAKTTFVQRVNTRRRGRTARGHLRLATRGRQAAFRPYTADYIFYTDE